jgi:cytochrome c peroxidase
MQTYDPYPPGIVPADLDSEVERVQREVRGLESQTLAEWHALPEVTRSNTQGVGNPPTLQGTGYQSMWTLGKLLLFDENMSPNRNVACNFCHMPYVAFSGPIPSVNQTMVAYPGSQPIRANKRTSQRFTYSPQFTVLQYSATQGLFFGGEFWDARATGYLLQSPDAEQAQHPPVDPGEMAFPDTACVAFRLSQAMYRPLFEAVWGAGSFDISWPRDTDSICATPGGSPPFQTATPIELVPRDRTSASQVYDHWGQSISAYEHSKNVSPFSSKFDAFLADPANNPLTVDEMAGYDLFRGKANCNSCHLDGRSTGPSTQKAPSGVDTGAAADVHPLFTCGGYANLGLPLNPRVALFYETSPDPLGFLPNPLGLGYRDLGLGTFLRSGFGSGVNPNSDWVQYAPKADGQMQTLTVRDAGMVPPQCVSTEAPGPYFQKEFFHNGYAKSLKQLVHFYNTRDVYPFGVTSGNCPAGKTEKVDCWPMPEVPNNIDMTVGNLGLTDHEEDLIVTFIQTLTDGYTTPYPDVNAFTGTCLAGGSAATQGNEFLIPTPPLPPCSPEICGVAPLPAPQPIP